MSQTCASCLTFSMDKITKSQPELKPRWLEEHDYVEEFIANTNNFKIRNTTKSNSKAFLEMKSCANKKILFWASESKEHHDILVKDAKAAYGDFSNHGVAKFDKDGKVCVKFRTPQVYSTIQKGKSKRQSFFHHLHFVIANQNENGWLQQIYTKLVIPVIEYSDIKHMMDHGCHVLINTLPCAYFAKDHIPNSFNLFYKDIKKMTVLDLHAWFSEVIKLHYPKLHNYVKKNKLQIYELPIACYCANKDCTASEMAIEELMKKGFVNCVEFQGGMKTYRQKVNSD